MMTRLSPTNTRWRDRYARQWLWALPVAAAAHLALFLFLPNRVSDRIHEALLPEPSTLARPGSAGPMESVELRAVALEEPRPQPPPEPEAEEEQEIPIPVETAAETITIAEVEAAPSEGEGTSEGVAGGEGEEPAGGVGGGSEAYPRPVFIKFPTIPEGVDRKKARGETFHLLVRVLPDGSVSDAKVEKGSRIDGLNEAVVAAALKGRWSAPERAMWVRYETSF